MSKQTAPFTEMAERLARNAEDAFGGAFVVVLPNGEALTGAIMGMSDPAAFLALVAARIEVKTAELQQEQQPGWGR